MGWSRTRFNMAIYHFDFFTYLLVVVYLKVESNTKTGYHFWDPPMEFVALFIIMIWYPSFYGW
jgi:hypothetical protein